jgi:hypothetical protein
VLFASSNAIQQRWYGSIRVAARRRPSDIHGLIYVPSKEDLREAALVLAKEINGQGIPIDLGKVQRLQS